MNFSELDADILTQEKIALDPSRTVIEVHAAIDKLIILYIKLDQHVHLSDEVSKERRRATMENRMKIYRAISDNNPNPINNHELEQEIERLHESLGRAREEAKINDITDKLSVLYKKLQRRDEITRTIQNHTRQKIEGLRYDMNRLIDMPIDESVCDTDMNKKILIGVVTFALLTCIGAAMLLIISI